MTKQKKKISKNQQSEHELVILKSIVTIKSTKNFKVLFIANIEFSRLDII